jgi:hypothetical protein
MVKVFISGSMSIKHLDREVIERINNILTSDYCVIVGDADGVDSAVQRYLESQGARAVIVYCTGDMPRNNFGHWKTKNIYSSATSGTREYFTAKDITMAEDCDYGLMVWDTKSSGTLNNTIELLKLKKVSLVYINKTTEFLKVKDADDLEKLLRFMSQPSLKKVEAKLGLLKKVAELKSNQTQLFHS